MTDKTAAEMVAEIRRTRSEDRCINCGYPDGLHRVDTNQCPRVPDGGRWLDTTYEAAVSHVLTDDEAARELEAWADERKSAPTPAAEELAKAIDEVGQFTCVDPACEACKGIYSKVVKLLDSALTQAAADARREAAVDMCNNCGVCGDGDTCRDTCSFYDAILGRKP